MPNDDVTVRAFRAARAWKGVSQTEIAQAMGTSAMTVKRIEAGDRELSPPERMFVANYCGVSEDFLAGGFDALVTA